MEPNNITQCIVIKQHFLLKSYYFLAISMIFEAPVQYGTTGFGLRCARFRPKTGVPKIDVMIDINWVNTLIFI